MPPHIRNMLATACSVALALGACTDATSFSANSRPLTISFSTRAASASSSIGVGALSAVAGAASADDSVTLTKAQLVIREIDLEPARGLGCPEDHNNDDDKRGTVAMDRHGSNSGRGSDDSGGRGNDDNGRNRGDDDDCVDVEIGPVLVDLPLTGQIQSRFEATVPEGDFREIEIRIDKPEDDDSAGRAFVAQNPAFKDISVRAEGTFKGQPFKFTARVKAKLEFEFNPALVVGADGTNITIRVLVGRWFRGADGSAIDPATAGPGGANAERVIRNIAGSIQAFADSNRDGAER